MSCWVKMLFMPCWVRASFVSCWFEPVTVIRGIFSLQCIAKHLDICRLPVTNKLVYSHGDIEWRNFVFNIFGTIRRHLDEQVEVLGARFAEGGGHIGEG